MKTLKEFYLKEAKTKEWPGSHKGSFKRVTPSQYEKALAKHAKPSMDLPGYPQSKGRIYAHRFEDGSIGHQHWTDGSDHPSTYKIKHPDGTFTYWVKNKQLKEGYVSIDDPSDNSGNIHSKYIDEAKSDVHSDLEKIGFKKTDNWMYDHFHTGSVDPKKMHKVLEKHGYKMSTHYASGGLGEMPKYAHYKKEHGYSGSENVSPRIKDGKVTHLTFKFSRNRD